MPNGSVSPSLLSSIGRWPRLLFFSPVHEWLARFLAPLKDDLRYTPSDCFETFPSPPHSSIPRKRLPPLYPPSLKASGERYHQFRAELMVNNKKGLTSTYNRFHDPSETSSDLLELRRLHARWISSAGRLRLE